MTTRFKVKGVGFLRSSPLGNKLTVEIHQDFYLPQVQFELDGKGQVISLHNPELPIGCLFFLSQLAQLPHTERVICTGQGNRLEIKGVLFNRRGERHYSHNELDSLFSSLDPLMDAARRREADIHLRALRAIEGEFNRCFSAAEKARKHKEETRAKQYDKEIEKIYRERLIPLVRQIGGNTERHFTVANLRNTCNALHNKLQSICDTYQAKATRFPSAVSAAWDLK